MRRSWGLNNACVPLGFPCTTPPPLKKGTVGKAENIPSVALTVVADVFGKCDKDLLKKHLVWDSHGHGVRGCVAESGSEVSTMQYSFSPVHAPGLYILTHCLHHFLICFGWGGGGGGWVMFHYLEVSRPDRFVARHFYPLDGAKCHCTARL